MSLFTALLGGASLPVVFLGRVQGLAAAPTIATGGTGHFVGEQITLSGGVFDAPSVVQVSSISGDAITGVTVVTNGNYVTPPTNPVSGGNATFTCSFSPATTGCIPNALQAFFAQNNAAMHWNSIDPRQNVGSSGYFGNSTYLEVHSTVEFIANTTQLEMYVLGFTTNFDVTVDGQQTNLTGPYTTDSSGQGYTMTMRWPTKKARTIRFSGFNFAFGGCSVVNTDSVSAPPTTGRLPLAFFLGDSYTVGNGALSTTRNWCNVLSAIKGYECLQDGVGGAGWLSTTPYVPNTRVTADLALRTHTPDKIFCAMGFNDSGGDMPTLTTNFNTAIATIKADFPSAAIKIIGPWTPIGGTANLTLVKNALIAACVTSSVPYVDIENIVNAGNSALYTSNDNVHPTQAGHTFLGQQIAALV